MKKLVRTCVTHAAPDWGLHIIDMQAVQGDLIRLVRRQSAALRGERG